MIWATVSSQSCFCWLYRASPSLATKNHSDFAIDHLVMSMCRVFSCVVERGCFLRSVCSLGKTLLVFALLHSVLQGQICLLLQVALGESSGTPLQYSCLENPMRKSYENPIRVGHDWATSLSLFTLTHWRRKWQPTPVFLPGESQGRGSLVGCSPWSLSESDTAEVT